MTSFDQGYALVIGVGADLPNTVQDAQGVAAQLKDPERCGYPDDHVHLLVGPKATRDAIFAGLDHLAASTSATSTVVIYFSGHGYKAASTLGEAYYLMPYGYEVSRLYQTAVSGQEFTQKLRAIPAKKLLLLLDCCHAGGVGEAKAPGVALSKSPLPPDAVTLLSEGSGHVLIASSQEDELSYAGKPYSAFTLAFIESLSGIGVAKKDGYVRVTDVALHAREVVPGRTHGKQHPVLHFEHADNFALAYYAGGDSSPKGLPFPEEPQIEPEPGAWTISTVINTGGGAYIGGNVSTGGGAFVGRDQHNVTITGDGNVIGDHSRSTVIKSGQAQAMVTQVFQGFYVAVAVRPDLSSEDKEDLRADLESLAADLSSGRSVDEERLARQLRTIGRVDALTQSQVLGVLANPATGLSPVVQGVAARLKKDAAP